MEPESAKPPTSVKTPDWVKDAVFYEIFPDRFARGSNGSFIRRSAKLEAWGSPPTLHGFKGGDLYGIAERMDYLAHLGVTALYLTPVFSSTANHRYQTRDYFEVDPLLGGNQALDALLRQGHARGIRVILDGVFNHASRGFHYFNDILENGPHSPWLDWFRIEKWPLRPYTRRGSANYATWHGYRSLPQFNHDNPAVREYLMRVGEHWIERGIDGWRLDVPGEITAPGFWEEFRRRIKGINPEAYIVGEIWRNARPWLDGRRFDGVMNYLFAGPTIAFAGGRRVRRSLIKGRDYDAWPALDAEQYGRRMRALMQMYPWEVQLSQLNLLSSHDTARLLSIAKGDRSSVKLATLLLMTAPGAPCVYYGEEVGLEGGLDPDCRRCFPEKRAWDIDLLNFHRKLIALRHAQPALRRGSYRIRYADGHCYAFERVTDAGACLVAVNAGDQPTRITLEGNERGYELAFRTQAGDLKSDLKTGKTGRIRLKLPPRQGCILVARQRPGDPVAPP